jgi:indolepyruvate ferredoxin oxidoreductase
MERAHDYLNRVSAAGVAAVTLAADQQRKPFFCSGCPHNTSTRLPEGSRALAGIGCHYMASFNDPSTDLNTHMGGEGLTWVGASAVHHRKARLRQPGRRHLQPLRLAGHPRLGRGQVEHHLQAAVQRRRRHDRRPAAESGFTPAQITRQLAAEGVQKTVIVVDEPERYEAVRTSPPASR